MTSINFLILESMRKSLNLSIQSKDTSNINVKPIFAIERTGVEKLLFLWHGVLALSDSGVCNLNPSFYSWVSLKNKISTDFDFYSICSFKEANSLAGENNILEILPYIFSLLFLPREWLEVSLQQRNVLGIIPLILLPFAEQKWTWFPFL